MRQIVPSLGTLRDGGRSRIRIRHLHWIPRKSMVCKENVMGSRFRSPSASCVKFTILFVSFWKSYYPSAVCTGGNRWTPAINLYFHVPSRYMDSLAISDRFLSIKYPCRFYNLYVRLSRKKKIYIYKVCILYIFQILCGVRGPNASIIVEFTVIYFKGYLNLIYSMKTIQTSFL